MYTAYHAKYYAHALTQRHSGTNVGRLSQSMFDASVDLNPHQIEAALFALRNPLQEGVLLADEVGLGKTIEAALVLCQLWAERKRRQLIIAPASLRQQWAREIIEKFAMPTLVLDSATLKSHQAGDTLQSIDRLAGEHVLIMSYSFARRLETELRAIPWDIVVMDEAHKIRNAHRTGNVTGRTLLDAFSGRKKLLLTATPLQNSLLELFGLGLFLDEHLFGDKRSFRQQFMHAGGDHEHLQNRVSDYIHRTLRKDVLEYVRYTKRQTITQPFNPTAEEHQLYLRVSDFIQREDSIAIPKSQRHLIALVLRKLLASSTPAILATLEKIRERLHVAYESNALEVLENEEPVSWCLNEDMGSDYTLEEFSDSELNAEPPTEENQDQDTASFKTPEERRAQLEEEIHELDAIIAQASSLTHDSKAQALLRALSAGFDRMTDIGAPQKAIVFTESRRTQQHLSEFLEQHGYEGKTVTFSGTNTSTQAKRVYQDWKSQYEDTDYYSGSRQIDQRTALIEHFRKADGSGADIMVATEAASEGVNLQFCSLVINYDLPWNPQRVEQRIGRCHRYGQKYDVVVINFLNNQNEADKRVLELLTEKFQLFSGVFGASDEVLGRVENGIDFEKRILAIYNSCRTPKDIEHAFNALQKDLEDAISTKMEETQEKILQTFDEDVHDRLKLRLDEAETRLSKLSRWFWGITRYALTKRATFDEDAYAFNLSSSPLRQTNTGRYQFIRGATNPELHAHAYRITHPLGEWVVEQALNAPTPTRKLLINYSKHPHQISDVAALQGQSGWLTLSRVQIKSYDTTEALIFSGVTDSGKALDQSACERLLNVESKGGAQTTDKAPPTSLAANQKKRIDAIVQHALETSHQLFHEERDKLDRWADDKILSAERALNDTKTRLRRLKNDARKAQSLKQEEAFQLEISALEKKKRNQRRDIFDVEDAIEEKRDTLIDHLQKRMHEATNTEILYTLRWRVV